MEIRLGTLLLLAACSAPATNATFHNFWLDDELPGKTVWAIGQDSFGFLWSGGEGGVARYDGNRFEKFPFPDTRGSIPSSAIVRDMVIARDNSLWIGTLRDGAYRGTPYGTLDEPSEIIAVQSVGQSIRSLLQTESQVYAGTSAGLELWNAESDRFERVDTGGEIAGVTELHLVSQTQILVGTESGVYDYDPVAKTLTPIAEGLLGNSIAYFILSAPDGHYWIGTDLGLARVSADQPTASIIDFTRGETVFSGVLVGEELWIGTRERGAYRIRGEQVVARYDHHPRESGSLSDSAVTSLFVDDAGVLWLGTFSGGLDRIDLSVLRFGWHDAKSPGFECLTDSDTYAVFSDSPSRLWLGTTKDLIQVDTLTNQCTYVPRDAPGVTAITRAGDGSIWISTFDGVAKVTETPDGFQVSPVLRKHYVYFITSVNERILLYGSRDGLFLVDPSSNSAELVPLEPGERQPSVFAAKKDADGSYWLATNSGVYRWDATSGTSAFIIEGFPPRLTIDTVASGKNGLWVAIRGHGLVETSYAGKVLSRVPANEIGTISSIIELDDAVWITTTNGLFKYYPDLRILHRYGAQDGLQSDVFIRNSMTMTSDGRLFVGGRRGWNEFRPEDIQPNEVAPGLAFTGLKLFNKPVSITDESAGFSLPSSMELLDELSLAPANDHVSIEFAALHYADPDRNMIEYKLEGFDTDWSRALPGQRSATYTNLPWGEYVFRVRAANEDGVWNLDGISLPITVQTPIWARWWAFVAYFLLLIGLAMAFAHLRSAAAIRRADELQEIVNARTRELADRNHRVEEQKSTIEDLLRRKDSLFANVSHEFRTPLTLILGPLDDLIDGAKGHTQKSMFRRIRRNAERLLHLVDQLLFLARTSTRVSQKRESIQLQETVDYLAASFRPLAQKKHLSINIETLQPSRTFAIPDAVETMVSNLLSNAIKYTPQGGSVALRLYQTDGFARLEVEDSGPGMSAAEKSQIFERFTRLPEHQELQGTGIGLALVRELAEAHGGEIEVDSQPGHGSVFSLLLPLADDDEALQIGSASAPVDEPEVKTPISGIRSKPKVLVIDDDYDMLSYVAECLAKDFRCVTAVNGNQGLEKALDVVPDLVVSDVMMPEMDGFELSKRIREDERLSHIPIVLLTARGGRDSRIKAWDIYVDDYIVKPFHADELRSRLHSLLNVRALLRSQVRSDLGEEGASTSLNKKEQAFVDRLTTVIEHRYSEFGLTRADLAGEMAVSERQLQRKLKAITDQNPSEFLREFRLRKARVLLADGEQVTLTSEKCGFASPSQFGFAFKKRYGTTPKKFQMGEQSRA